MKPPILKSKYSQIITSFSTKGFYIKTLAGLLLLFGSCSRKVPQADIPFEKMATFSASGTEELQDKWWKAFEDPVLNIIVDSALTSNFNLKTAWQQLQAADAVAKKQQSFLFPDIDASIQSGISRPRPDFVGGENVRLSLNASYEVDLWGRIRSRADAERYRAEASFYDYQAASLSLSAEIVRTWYRLTTARQQLQLINDQVVTNEKILTMIRNRFGSGQVRGVDILRQQQLLESTKEQKIVIESRVAILEHQLAVLLGRPPQEKMDYATGELPLLPSLPAAGVPLELVRRRPDVQSAHYRLLAADKDMASAVSSQYPRLSISATTAIRSNDVDNLFGNWARALAGNLMAPLFYGGRLRAEVDRTEAVKDQRLYEYAQTVLVAFREVEDALILEEKQQERIAVLEEQLKFSDQTYQQLELSYLNGMSDYLDVLTILTQQQRLQRDLLTAKLTLMEYRIALYRALAGGFQTEREKEK